MARPRAARLLAVLAIAGLATAAMVAPPALAAVGLCVVVTLAASWEPERRGALLLAVFAAAAHVVAAAWRGADASVAALVTTYGVVPAALVGLALHAQALSRRFAQASVAGLLSFVMPRHATATL